MIQARLGSTSLFIFNQRGASLIELLVSSLIVTTLAIALSHFSVKAVGQSYQQYLTTRTQAEFYWRLVPIANYLNCCSTQCLNTLHTILDDKSHGLGPLGAIDDRLVIAENSLGFVHDELYYAC